MPPTDGDMPATDGMPAVISNDVCPMPCSDIDTEDNYDQYMECSMNTPAASWEAYDACVCTNGGYCMDDTTPTMPDDTMPPMPDDTTPPMPDDTTPSMPDDTTPPMPDDTTPPTDGDVPPTDGD